MKNFLIIFYVLILLINAPQNVAANDVALKDLSEELKAQSLIIQKASSTLREAEWKKTESYSGVLPSLTLSASYLLDKKYLLTDIQFAGSPTATSIPQIIPTTNYLLSAQIPLFDGFAAFNRIEAAKQYENSSREELNHAEFNALSELKLHFYRALASQLLKEVAEQNLRALQDHLKEISQFKKVGISTQYDVLKVEVQVNEASAEVLNSRDNEVLAKLKLAEVLGKENETRNLIGDLPIPDLSKINSYESEKDILKQRSDLRGLEYKIESLRLQNSSASKYWIPKIALFGTYQYYNNINDSLSDSSAFRDAHQVGLNLVWNIFDGMSSVSRSHQTYEQLYQNEKSLQQSKIKSKQEFEMWKRKYLYFCSVYKTRLVDIEKAKETVRLAKEGRKVGIRTNTDLLDAELELFKSKAGVISTQIGAIEALVRLEMTLEQKILQ